MIDTFPDLSLLTPAVHLTRREAQIVGLLAEGHSNKEIASQMGVGEGTIKVYLNRLFGKLQCRSRHQVAMKVKSGALCRRNANDSLRVHLAGLGSAEGAD